MDFRDTQVGANKEHFWFRGKRDFIDGLFTSVHADKQQKILDIGAGTGDDIMMLKQHGNIYALDIDEQALSLIDDALVVEKKLGSACAIPYQAGTFDVVVAFDVLEHVEDDSLMVDEIMRVLKSGGHFIFTVPAFNCLYSSHDRTLGHHRRYNKAMITQLLDKKMRKQTLGYWFCLLFAPALMQRFLTKKASSSSIKQFPHVLNQLFYGAVKMENWCIKKGLRMPFGLSVYGVYRKK